MEIVSDSTPLIYLSKIGCINFLKDLFDKIIIPNNVYEEVVVQGKRRGKNDVLLIESNIEKGFIEVKDVKSTLELNNLDKGEKECIALCKELDITNLLIDEKEGFNISSMFNLTPLRTTSVLIILLDKKIINLIKYKELLKNLAESGYFIDVPTYEKLIMIGENIAKK